MWKQEKVEPDVPDVPIDVPAGWLDSGRELRSLG